MKNRSAGPTPSEAPARGCAGEGETEGSDPLFEFYSRPLPAGPSGSLRSRYEIWEDGEAYGDSVTPSTYCEVYRKHMVLKIASLLGGTGNVFSIGCGNAFVEASLVARGWHVRAIDCNVEAVALAKAKGVDAISLNYFEMPSGSLGAFDIIYADGVLGHLYRPDMGLDGFFQRLTALAPAAGAWLVLSNDAPAESEEEVAINRSVTGFWLLSEQFLTETLLRFGLVICECYSFSYQRPVSGRRDRTICIARVPEAGLFAESINVCR